MQHPEGVDVGVVGRYTGQDEIGVELLDPLALLDEQARPPPGCLQRRPFRPEVPPGRLEVGQRRRRPRWHHHHQHQVGGTEVGPVEGDQIIDAQAFHDVSVAQHRPGDRVLPPAGLQRQLRNHFRGRVLHQVELGRDHRALEVQLVWADDRPDNGIKHQLRGLLQALHRDVGGHRADLPRGEGVHRAPQGVGQLGDPLRRALAAAPQQQVLQQVGDAGQLPGLAGRATAHPEAHRRGGARCGLMQDDGSGLHERGSVPARGPGPGVRGPGSGVRGPGSGVRGPGSGVRGALLAAIRCQPPARSPRRHRSRCWASTRPFTGITRTQSNRRHGVT